MLCMKQKNLFLKSSGAKKCTNTDLFLAKVSEDFLLRLQASEVEMSFVLMSSQG